jgi:hypothetical protein
MDYYVMLLERMRRVSDSDWLAILPPPLLEYNRGRRIYEGVRDLFDGRANYDYLKK